MSNNLWYRRIGFHNNPFSIKPAAYSDNVEGFNNAIDDISYAILTKKLVFIEGEYGQGKTTILKKLINDFGGRKQVAYFSCNRLNGRLDIKRLLRGRYGFLGKLFDLEAKDMILLLDESQYLGKEDYKELNEHYKLGKLKSVVFVSSKLNGNTEDLTPNGLVVNLKKLNQTEAVSIVRRRVGQLHLLSDDIINETFEMSNRNIRELLKNCEKLCKYAVDNEMTKVTSDLIKEVIGGVSKKTEEKKEEKRLEEPKKEKKSFLKKHLKSNKTKTEQKENPKEELQVAAKAKPKEDLKEEDPLDVVEELEQDVPLEEEDDIDKQVKALAMSGDDDDFDEAEVPKRKKKEPVSKLGSDKDLLPEELSEEEYY